jgi:PEP-CTERM motif
MKMVPKVLFAAIGLASFGVAPASSTTLIGQTINADITITGSDDNGSYSLVVLNGPVSIPGPGDFTDTIAVFKQLTLGGFSTASNQINGNVHIDISANAISVTMNGQVQPFELESQFTGIGGTITNVVSTATGVIPGVNGVLFSNFTSTSVDFASIYFGFQPGTSLTQTETLTFAAAGGVPEPSTWAMMLIGFAGLGFAFRQSRRKESFA